MNRIVSRILRDIAVRQFLFKYSALVLAFGVTTMFGVVQSLAPLEHEVYKEFYLAQAEAQIVKDCPETSPEFVRASARLEAAKHSKALISSVAGAVDAIWQLCFLAWGVMFILASTHWLCFLIEDKRPWER